MQITNNSQTSFNGIYLKNVDFPEVRDIVMSLKFRGFHPLGHKTYFLPKGDVFEMCNKAKEIKQIGMKGIANEFGTLLFPWRRSAFFIAEPKVEMEMYRLVKKTKPSAELYLLV